MIAVISGIWNECGRVRGKVREDGKRETGAAMNIVSLNLPKTNKKHHEINSHLKNLLKIGTGFWPSKIPDLSA